MRRKVLHSSLFLLALTIPTVQGALVTDPTGDFISSYAAAAPRAGDLDVVTAEVTLSGSNFILTSTLAAPINTTPEAFYVWGFNRGAGSTTANFASLGLPNVIFDSVVVIQNEGTGVVNDLTGINPQVTLAGGSITSSGNTITAVVPVSALPTRGFALNQYQWNLWPRFGGAGITGTAQISDFAPNSTDAPVTVSAVPEPTSLLLIGSGLLFAMAGRYSARKLKRQL